MSKERQSNFTVVNEVKVEELEAKLNALKDSLIAETDIEKNKEIINASIKATDFITILKNQKKNSIRFSGQKLFVLTK
jgi:hypothetical protein